MAVLGPDGAGKSAIDLILGLSRPDSGRVSAVISTSSVIALERATGWTLPAAIAKAGVRNRAEAIPAAERQGWL